LLIVLIYVLQETIIARPDSAEMSLSCCNRESVSLEV